MTEHQEKKVIAEKPSSSNKGKPKKTRWPSFTWLLWLILFGTASLLGFNSWDQNQSKQALSALTVRSHELGIKQVDLQQAQLNSLESMQVLRQELDQKLTDLGDAITELSSLQSGQTRRDSRWKLAEVSYLVRIAEHALAMQQQPGQALTALQEADELLASLDVPGVFALRAALAGDIGSLRNFQSIDQVGIFLQIASMAGQVEKLELAVRGFSSEKPIEQNFQEDSPDLLGSLLALLNQFGQKVFSLVDFRRGDIEIKPLPTPEQTTVLRQNILLQLQTAQLALLRGEQRVFQSSIEQAQAWIENYFNLNLSDTRQLVEQLRQLHDIPISATLPQLTETLLALDELQSLQQESLE
jgi:uroporphyrin-3 C-methyltransferase